MWRLILVPLAFAGWFGMTNIRTQDVTPEIAGGALGAFAGISSMLLVGFVTAGVYPARMALPKS